jgi:hypothetical protein
VPINSHLFEAYLKCPTKCFLRSLGETGTENSYANWASAQHLSYSSEGIKQLVKGFAEDDVITGTIDSDEKRSPKWRLTASGQENVDRHEVLQRWCQEVDNELLIVELQVREMR